MIKFLSLADFYIYGRPKFWIIFSGFDDILYAIPVTENRLPRLVELNDKIDLKILINNPDMIIPLENAKKSMKNRWNVLIEVSTGYEVINRAIYYTVPISAVIIT